MQIVDFIFFFVSGKASVREDKDGQAVNDWMNEEMHLLKRDTLFTNQNCLYPTPQNNEESIL